MLGERRSNPANYPWAVLFGGAGFIGRHLADVLLQRGIVEKVVIADIVEPQEVPHGCVFVCTDVREPISPHISAVAPRLIVNLAAVHREPGHEPYEYFETNVSGAENVCRYADAVGCMTLAFTSSISVYGPTEVPKDERHLPVPVSPYGSSKLVAESIHRQWQVTNRAAKRLLVVRPGVIFGPGECGNVTRLVRSICRGYFAYCGNHHVRKAGGYVLELCNSLLWWLENMEAGTDMYNFSFDPTPRFDEFVATIADVAGRKTPTLSVPYKPMFAASHVAHRLSSLVGLSQPLHPLRVQKLTRSNHIVARALVENGYAPLYSLKTALEDWRRRQPSDWRV